MYTTLTITMTKIYEFKGNLYKGISIRGGEYNH